MSLIFAGLIGGLIAMGGTQFLQQNEVKSANHNYAQQVRNDVKYNAKPVLPFDFKVAAEKSMPTVVHISASESRSSSNRGNDDVWGQFFGGRGFDQPQQGTGSGVIISEDGYIVTNNHVVGNADIVEVTLYDNRKFDAQIIGTDSQSDLAVIKIDVKNLPTLQRADSDKAQVGEWVLAVGNPFDLTSTVTAGIISAKGRDININDDARAIESFIQTDAAVNPGNSGGALVDAEGRLLGINTAIATRTGSFSGYSFAIPVNIMSKIVDDIIRFGSYQRGFLGVNIMDMDSDLATEMGLNISQGVVIESILDGGAAQFAGIKPNDVIIEVNGTTVKSAPELQDLIGRARVGEVVNIKVNRYGSIKKFPIKLKAG